MPMALTESSITLKQPQFRPKASEAGGPFRKRTVVALSPGSMTPDFQLGLRTSVEAGICFLRVLPAKSPCNVSVLGLK